MPSSCTAGPLDKNKVLDRTQGGKREGKAFKVCSNLNPSHDSTQYRNSNQSGMSLDQSSALAAVSLESRARTSQWGICETPPVGSLEDQTTKASFLHQFPFDGQICSHQFLICISPCPWVVSNWADFEEDPNNTGSFLSIFLKCSCCRDPFNSSQFSHRRMQVLLVGRFLKDEGQGGIRIARRR